MASYCEPQPEECGNLKGPPSKQRPHLRVQAMEWGWAALGRAKTAAGEPEGVVSKEKRGHLC